MKGEVSSGVMEMLTCLVQFSFQFSLEKANSKQKQRSLSPKKTIIKQRSNRAIWKFGYSHTDDKSQKIQKSVNDRAFPVERDTSHEHSIIYVISIKQNMTWTLRKNLIPTSEWKP